MCLSTAEYACSVWSRLKHAKQVTTALNDTCRIITGCMKATPLPIRYLERFKQTFEDRHLLHQLEEPGSMRHKSRKRFMRTVDIELPESYPLHQEPSHGIETEWKIWRMRSGVALVKSNLAKWGVLGNDDVLCECGETPQGKKEKHLRQHIKRPQKKHNDAPLGRPPKRWIESPTSQRNCKLENTALRPTICGRRRIRGFSVLAHSVTQRNLMDITIT